MYTFSAETNTKCSSKSVVQSIQSCWCPEIIVQPSLKISRVLDKFRHNGLNRLIMDINWVSRQDMGNILITSFILWSMATTPHMISPCSLLKCSTLQWLPKIVKWKFKQIKYFSRPWSQLPLDNAPRGVGLAIRGGGRRSENLQRSNVRAIQQPAQRGYLCFTTM